MSFSHKVGNVWLLPTWPLLLDIYWCADNFQSLTSRSYGLVCRSHFGRSVMAKMLGVSLVVIWTSSLTVDPMTSQGDDTSHAQTLTHKIHRLYRSRAVRYIHFQALTPTHTHTQTHKRTYFDLTPKWNPHHLFLCYHDELPGSPKMFNSMLYHGNRCYGNDRALKATNSLVTNMSPPWTYVQGMR